MQPRRGNMKRNKRGLGRILWINNQLILGIMDKICQNKGFQHPYLLKDRISLTSTNRITQSQMIWSSVMRWMRSRDHITFLWISSCKRQICRGNLQLGCIMRMEWRMAVLCRRIFRMPLLLYTLSNMKKSWWVLIKLVKCWGRLAGIRRELSCELGSEKFTEIAKCNMEKFSFTVFEKKFIIYLLNTYN